MEEHEAPGTGPQEDDVRELLAAPDEDDSPEGKQRTSDRLERVRDELRRHDEQLAPRERPG
jgi:hypothetical protein